MDQPIVIDQLDATAATWIEREAQRTGQPVAVVVRQLIYRGLALERQQASPQRYHDLDALAGTWDAAEAEEFHRAIVDLSQIDAGLWP